MSKHVVVAGSLSVVFVILVAFAFLGHKSTEAPHPSDDTTSIPSPEGDSNQGKASGTSQVAFTGNAGGTGNVPEPVAPAIPGPGTGPGGSPGPVAFGPTAGRTTASGSAGSPFPTQPQPTAPVEQPHPEPMAPAPETDQQSVHIVAHGETLGDISKQYYNSYKYWPKIAKANPNIEPNDLKEGEKIIIPPLSAVKPAASAPGEAAPTAGPGEALYTVQKGDSLYLIAEKQLGSASRWTEIRTLNKLDSDQLREGDQLRLPAKEEHADHPEEHAGGAPEAAGGRVHVVEEGETLGDISKQYYGTTRRWKDIVKANPGLDPDNVPVGAKLTIPELGAATPHSASQEGGAEPLNAGGSTYTVQSGDVSLKIIAKKTLGEAKAWKQILDANPGIDPTRLRIGQKLHIPGGAAAPVPAAGSGSFGPVAPTAPTAPMAPMPSAPSAPAPDGAQHPGGAGNGIGP